LKKMNLLAMAIFLSTTVFSTTYAASKALNGKDSKKLFHSLSVKVEDHDDIQNKNFLANGLKIKCERWVVDKAYLCTVELAD